MMKHKLRCFFLNLRLVQPLPPHCIIAIKGNPPQFPPETQISKYNDLGLAVNNDIVVMIEVIRH